MSEALHHGLNLIRNPKWREHQRRSINSGWNRWQRGSVFSKPDQITAWTDLLPRHIREFQLWMEDTMRWKRHTVSHSINPLRKASEWVQLNLPEIWKNPFIRKIKRIAQPASDRYLMPDQLATAINIARKMNEPGAFAALMFGGLSGIGLLELLDIKAEDITEHGLRVTRAKNAYRPRVIPMCEPLAQYAKAWRACFSRMPIRTDFVLSKKLRKVLDAAADETGDITFRMVTPHEATRVTFANNAKHAGVPEEALAAYMGHVGETTLERHYLKRIPRHDDLPRILGAKLEQLHAEVCVPLNQKLRDAIFM